MTDKATRLYPLPPREIPAGAIYEDLEVPPVERREVSRPYVIINMVSSVDGKTAVGGRAGRIGSQTDRQTMRNLRSSADAVMIGANTLRAEKLSLGLDDTARGGRQPIGVIITRSGDLPLRSNLIGGDKQEVFVISTEHAPENLAERLGETARVLRVPATTSGDVDLKVALRVLKAEHAVDLLLVEGGPKLNHSLIARNLVDEFFLTVAPKHLGGPSEETLAIVNGPAALAARDMKLLSAFVAGDELFVRYSLCLPEPAD